MSPENIEKVRNTLDDLMGDYDFLERKLRGRFGDNYGLEGFKTRSTKKKPKDYEPRKLHTKLILSQVKNGTSMRRALSETEVKELLRLKYILQRLDQEHAW